MDYVPTFAKVFPLVSLKSIFVSSKFRTALASYLPATICHGKYVTKSLMTGYWYGVFCAL
jgi:hypothetical protein